MTGRRSRIYTTDRIFAITQESQIVLAENDNAIYRRVRPLSLFTVLLTQGEQVDPENADLISIISPWEQEKSETALMYTGPIALAAFRDLRVRVLVQEAERGRD